MMEKTLPKKVFIAPLNWGLGHATRMIPVIEYCQKMGFTVVLGGDGQSGELLKTRFPTLLFEELPSYQISYSKVFPFVVQMIKSLPNINRGIKAEKAKVEELHLLHQFDLVISDNRYGVHVESVKSLIVSHQLNIQFPFFQRTIFYIQKKLFRKFDACLVADFPGKNNLAGNLSRIEKGQKLGVPLHYVGALSRFSNQEVPLSEKEFKYLAVVSGPEPYRSLLVNQLVSSFFNTDAKIAIASYGINLEEVLPNHISFYDNPSDQVFLELVAKSECLISRSGYSTLMDLVYLKIPVYLIPTPGQTEQEYLVKYWKSKGWSNYSLQKDFDPQKIIFEKQVLTFHSGLLEEVLGEII